ncbi:MAG: cation transporter [Myxococcota bacterium]
MNADIQLRPSSGERSKSYKLLLREGLRLEYFTIGWNVVEAVVAIGAGTLAGSIALVGFGLDSVIEVVAASMLAWRLLHASRAGTTWEEETKAERRALFVVGLTFWALAIYILYESSSILFRQAAPGESTLGIFLAVVSLIIMPWLGWRKLKVARKLGSRALRADAMETFVCSYLSFALLLGLGLNASLDWWWADPMAALAMLPLVVREGWEAVIESRAEKPGAKKT